MLLTSVLWLCFYKKYTFTINYHVVLQFYRHAGWTGACRHHIIYNVLNLKKQIIYLSSLRISSPPADYGSGLMNLYKAQWLVFRLFKNCSRIIHAAFRYAVFGEPFAVPILSFTSDLFVWDFCCTVSLYSGS